MKDYTNRKTGLVVEAIEVTSASLQGAVEMLVSASAGVVDYNADPYPEIYWCGHTIVTGDYVLRPTKSRHAGVMSAEMFRDTYEVK